VTSYKPLISIITVVRNAAVELEKTIISVLGQNWPHIEYIVIDGGSVDGTLDVIRAHADHVAFWASEPDQGIYDAMNKGLKYATGEWVIFLNAGDTFTNDLVLQQVFTLENPDTDVIYGDSIADYGQFGVYRTAGSLGDLWKGMFCSHQSMFFRRRLYDNRAYRNDLEIVADHEFIFRLHNEGFIFQHLPVPVVTWSTQGVSNRRQVKSVVERYHMIKHFQDHSLRRKCYYLLLLLLAECVQTGYWLLPEKWMKFVIREINKKSLAFDQKKNS
jgi:putative colanic acid biosynthesis glycosyltransferase